MTGILDSWINGRGLPDVLVIDGHIHIGGWPCKATFSLEDAAVKSAAAMDANGVDAVCAMSGGYMYPACDYRLGNDFLLAVWRKLPDRLIPFACINPNDSRANILAELKRMLDCGMHCIKLINSYQENYPGDGPNLMAVYEFAASHNMLILNHAWEPDALMKISGEYAKTNFILGHYFTGKGLEAVLRSRQNVYVNVWDLGNFGWIDRGLKNIGADKFILGSDGFLNPLSAGIGPVVFAPISDEQKRLVLGLTMARLLDQVDALPPVLKCKLDKKDRGARERR